jgi:hypothetical protein
MRDHVPSNQREYGASTSVYTMQPWGLFHSARLLCSDGKVRKTSWIADTADTFYSVPAKVSVAGKIISGYMTFKTATGSEVDTEADPICAVFHHCTRFNESLPEWKYPSE